MLEEGSSGRQAIWYTIDFDQPCRKDDRILKMGPLPLIRADEAVSFEERHCVMQEEGIGTEDCLTDDAAGNMSVLPTMFGQMRSRRRDGNFRKGKRFRLEIDTRRLRYAEFGARVSARTPLLSCYYPAHDTCSMKFSREQTNTTF